MEKIEYQIKLFKRIEFIVIILLSILFWFFSNRNFLLFHISIEVVGIIFGFSLMLIAVGTSKVSENKMFTYLGIIYGFVGLMDFVHTMSSEGIVIYTNNTNIFIQLRIVARLYEAIALVCSVFFIKRKINVVKTIFINLLIVIILFFLVFGVKIFPQCYIEGLGVTKVKVILEFVIISLYTLTIFLYRKYTNEMSFNTLQMLEYSLIFKIIGEVYFIIFNEQYNVFNYLGHINKGISIYLMYKVIFLAVILDPYNNIFNKLNKKAEDLEKANIIIENEADKYKKILDFFPNGIIKKENNKIIYVNKRFKEMFNIKDESELLQEKFDFIKYCKTKVIIQDNSIKEEKNLEAPVEREISINGIKVNVEISTLCIYRDEKKLYISVFRDIGDKKKTERIIAKLKEKEKEDELKNEFFSNISHELRTPINVIYSAIQTEKIFLKEKNLEAIEKYNSIINQNCFRLIRITNNIIDSTKIKSRFMKPKFNVINLVQLIEEITQSVVSYAEYKKIDIIFDTEEEEIYILCDIDYIERIILNLLSNAIKYSGEYCKIEVVININQNKEVLVLIKDNGIGIPENKKEEIFNRFEKIDKTMNRENEGSGIGLYIVKSLVELQGGVIWAEKNLEKGSSFFIKFPVVDVYDEICASKESESILKENNIIEKMNIEFSDIYLK
ncbi:MASE3 domain-containing sensor histidine kinase [Clostridium grantii]|uniref:histidine kinase n=1 Tax=Clostridium grantii DSM 8605 TaxID=1121316 RepID=A0A1M5W4P4_9CLOT|nr:MASE3 domain-containing protein [Clostridium grantii]SHH82421.1 PAS domain S-box-containing protein [Clostridium grantii DSM 8605]